MMTNHILYTHSTRMDFLFLLTFIAYICFSGNIYTFITIFRRFSFFIIFVVVVWFLFTFVLYHCVYGVNSVAWWHIHRAFQFEYFASSASCLFGSSTKSPVIIVRLSFCWMNELTLHRVFLILFGISECNCNECIIWYMPMHMISWLFHIGNVTCGAEWREKNYWAHRLAQKELVHAKFIPFSVLALDAAFWRTQN